jgi:DNA-directed RNA polymerase subunit beta
VIDVQVFTREGIERDKRAQSIIDDSSSLQARIWPTRCASSSATPSSVSSAARQGRANGGPKKLAKGTKITKELSGRRRALHWFDIRLATSDAQQQLEQCCATVWSRRARTSMSPSKRSARS